MRIGKTVSWFFVVYWGALINLGPSVHQLQHSDCHCHPIAAAAEREASQVEATSCCGHCEHDAETQSTKNGAVESYEDCLLCDFFKHYNVFLDDVVAIHSWELVAWESDIVIPQSRSHLRHATARGPPV